MARDLDFDFDDDFMTPRQPQRQSTQQRPSAPRQQQAGGRTNMQQRPASRDVGQYQQRPVRRENYSPAPARSSSSKPLMSSIIILAVEVLVFIGLLAGFFILKNKLETGNVAGTEAATEQAASAEGGATNNGVNVDNANFTLTCTKVQLTMDAEGNPAALIFFTFVNKTSTPLAMSEVFPPKVTQNGVDCPTFAALAEEPAELYNKDQQISDGASTDCCYAVSLQDLTSTLTLTIHDNYETFSDIGSTDIPLS